MGYRACFPRGEQDEIWGPTGQGSAAVVSFLLPEADAVTAVLRSTAAEVDLAIGTDSATIVYALQKVARTDFVDWSAIRNNESHLGPLVEATCISRHGGPSGAPNLVVDIF